MRAGRWPGSGQVRGTVVGASLASRYCLLGRGLGHLEKAELDAAPRAHVREGQLVQGREQQLHEGEERLQTAHK